MEMLSLIDGLCYVGLINPLGAVAGFQRQRLSLSIGPTE
jgi:hypothetical protein